MGRMGVGGTMVVAAGLGHLKMASKALQQHGWPVRRWGACDGVCGVLPGRQVDGAAAHPSTRRRHREPPLPPPPPTRPPPCRLVPARLPSLRAALVSMQDIPS
eukprot:1868402-Rhodomonas_salina.5